jgi:hypothetical protein
MTTSEQRQLGRAKNAVLSFLEKKLAVPRIYLDAEWAGRYVDILAIDRDGVGDVHVCLLFGRDYFPDGTLNIVAEAKAIQELLETFDSTPAQFKYVVAVEIDMERGAAPLRLSDPLVDRTYSPDGIGRVGILLVDFLLDGEPQARLLAKPERFRAKVGDLADDFVEKHTADWEIRA